MFGIGWQELIVIFLVLLIFVGPKRIPEIARSLGKFLRDFARAKEEVRRTIEKEFSLKDENEKGYLEISFDSEESKEKEENKEKEKEENSENKVMDGKEI